MPIESVTYISDLNPANPVGATDTVSTLDNHIRNIKTALQNDFAGLVGPIYSSGTWTPTVAFATPGNSNIVLSTASGQWVRVGSQMHVDFSIISSTFTHSTASGNLEVSGLPVAVNTFGSYVGSLEWQGITKASYTNIVAKTVASTTKFRLLACGSGQASANITASDVPSGGTVRIIGSLTYNV